MTSVVWTQSAIDDLRAVQSYLADIDDMLARDQIERIVAAATFLLDFPAIGTPIRARWRKWRVPKTRYLLIYRPARSGVQIGRVRYDRSDWAIVP